MLNPFLDVFSSLNSHGVKYLVIGGIAAIAHGVPRNTFDLDILIDATPENARRLLEALVSAGLGTASLIDASQLLAKEITIFKDIARVDVQTATPGLVFADAWSHRQTIPVAGVPVHVVSRNDLIASKRAAGRSVDLSDIKALEST